MRPLTIISAILAVLLTNGGCNKKEKVLEKKPRPVVVSKLIPPGVIDDQSEVQRLVKASVSAWRTETVSMEVGGRLEFLAEENTVFTLDDYDSDQAYVLLPTIFADSQAASAPENNSENDSAKETPNKNQNTKQTQVDEGEDNASIRPPQLLARIDKSKYEIQVARAEASLAKTEAAIAATKVELEGLLPAERDAAQAEKDLAVSDSKRADDLFREGAGSEAETTRYAAKLKKADAALRQAIAAKDAKEKELEALKKKRDEEGQSLRDAKRELENCDLIFRRFRGELTNLDVENGDLIQPNQVIGRVQMMDPIMIEFEVSSEESRRLAKIEKLKVKLPDNQIPDSEEKTDGENAYMYEIDSVADPSSRTFTVKMLMVNRRTKTNFNETTPSAESRIPLNFSFLGESVLDKPLACEKWIFKDEKGNYLLKINGLTKGEPLGPDRKVKVTKVYVNVSAERTLFYGDLYFREISPVPGQQGNAAELDIHKDLVVGPVTLPRGAKTWDWEKNNEVIIQNSAQWLLRPGDLVDIDISSEANADSYYRLPIDAVSSVNGEYFIFLVKRSEKEKDLATVEKVQVQLPDLESNLDDRKEGLTPMAKIQFQNPEVVKGREYVSKGSHYLIDGEVVRIVPRGQ